jgi:hypothetical protein
MYYSNCNSSLIGNYDQTSSCWKNIYSRSPSLVSQECTVSDKQTSAFCFSYSYNYTNYLTNSLVGYFYFNQGCTYIRTDDLSYQLNMYNSYSLSLNYSTAFPGSNLPLTAGLKYLLCNTSDCNSQYAGACISAELIQAIYSIPNVTSQIRELTSLPVYQSCSSGSSSNSLPTFKLTITIGLRVNQVFISDYNNLNSAASLSFIQNFTNFVNTHIL